MTKSQDLELIANSIRGKRSIAFMKGLFRTINQLYRECIDRAQTNHQDDSGSEISAPCHDDIHDSVPTVSLSQLEESISEGEAVITEIDMVDAVFDVIRYEESSDLSYLLTVSMAYANSLFSLLIFPHRRLQLFLFRLCSDTCNFTTLQYLLNFGLIMDSSEILDQLGSLIEKHKEDQPWLILSRMDMAKRLKRTEIVVECLIQQDRSLEIIDYIRSQDPTFDMETVFKVISTHKCINRKLVWEQVEAWNITPGLKEGERPALSHKVVMLNL